MTRAARFWQNWTKVTSIMFVTKLAIIQMYFTVHNINMFRSINIWEKTITGIICIKFGEMA